MCGGLWVYGNIRRIDAFQLVRCRKRRPTLPSPLTSDPLDRQEAEPVRARENQVEAAFQRGDTGFLQAALGHDIRFTHGNGAAQGKAEVLSVFAKPGNFVSRTLTAIRVEMHGDVALTSGRKLMEIAVGGLDTEARPRDGEAARLRRDCRWTWARNDGVVVSADVALTVIRPSGIAPSCRPGRPSDPRS